MCMCVCVCTYLVVCDDGIATKRVVTDQFNELCVCVCVCVHELKGGMGT